MLYTVLLLGVLYPVHNESPPPELIKFSNLGRSISTLWGLRLSLLGVGGGGRGQRVQLVETETERGAVLQIWPDPNFFGRILIRSNRPDPTKKCHKTRNKSNTVPVS